MNTRNQQTNLVIELSPRQVHLLQDQQLHPLSPVYNVYTGFLVKGLTSQQLQEAGRQLLLRHPLLNCRWQAGSDNLVTCTDAHEPGELFTYDPELSEDLRGWCRAQVTSAISLKGKLYDCRIKACEAGYLVLFKLHHVICDQWSLQVLVNDFLASLESLLEHKDATLEPLDYTSVSEQSTDDEPLYQPDHALDFNDTGLQQTQNKFSGLGEFDTLNDEYTRLAELAGEYGVSRFSVLLACWFLALYRHSGQTDLTISIPVARRSRKNRYHLGHFVDLQPVSITAIDSLSIQELLRKLEQQTMTALRSPAADPQGHKHNVICNYLPQLKIRGFRPGLMGLLSGVQSTPLSLANGQAQCHGLCLSDAQDSAIAQVDLELTLFEVNDALHTKLIGRANYFDQQELAHLAELFSCALTTLTPTQPQAIVNHLTSDRGFVSLPEQPHTHILQHLHQLTQQQGTLCAAEDEHTALSYAELMQALERRAAQLSEQGVCKGMQVAVCLDKSLDSLVTILALWRLEAVSLHCDIAWPKERLLACLDQPGLSLLLLSQETNMDMPCRTLVPAQLSPPQQALTTSIEELDATAAAYVIFTSGTSGKPKGVLVSHAGLMPLARAQQTLFNVSPDDRVLQFASLSFDAAISEIVVTLAAGATLVMAKQADTFSHQTLLALLNDLAITSVTLPPSLIQLLQPDQVPQLKTLISAGEACPKKLIQLWPQHLRFVNAYGPTECTVCVSAKVITSEQLAKPEVLHSNNIGRPIAGMQVQILTPQGRQVPDMCWGELCVSAVGLALGYIGQPEATANVFIEQPDEPTLRYYRTGDKARLLHNGELEIAGRIDQQVKVRGFRIEPEEIAQHLTLHPQVRQSCILALQQSGKTYLHACYVAEPDCEISAQTLQSYLAERLPYYMVPTRWSEREVLPLNVSGKIDKQRLSESVQAEVSQPQIADRAGSEQEQTIQAIWQALLGHPVALDTNLFELGVDSLQLSQAHRQACQALNSVAGIKDFYQATSIAQQTSLLLAQPGQPQTSSWSAPTTDTQRFARPSLSAERLWFVEQHEGAQARYNIPIALRIQGALDSDKLTACLNQVAARHEILRTAFRIEEGELTTHLVTPPKLQVEHLCVTEFDDEAQRLKAAADVYQSQLLTTCFDLSQPPLLRCALIELGNEDHVLALVFHHIVADASSGALFLRELTELWQQPDLQTTHWPQAGRYSDYARMQHAWLQSPACARQQTFWHDYLNEAQALAFPVAGVVDAGDRAGTVRREIPTSLSTAMKQLAVRLQVSENMLYLASFQVLLWHYSRQSRFVIGLPASERKEAQQYTLGFFINTLPLLAEVDPQQSFTALAGQVKEHCLSVLEHADLPYHHILQSSEGAATGAKRDLVQVLFSWVQAQPDIQLPGLDMAPFAVDAQQAKFPLTMNVLAGNDRVELCFEYALKAMDSVYADDFIDNWLTLCEDLVKDSSKRVDKLNCLSEQKRTEILYERNNTEVALPKTKNIYTYFREQVQLHGEHTALSCDKQSLNYDSLQQQAEQVAHQLHQQGIVAGDKVALCYQQGSEGLIAILATVRLGAVYVPVSVDYPLSRIKHLLKASDAKVLLSDVNEVLDAELACPCLNLNETPTPEDVTLPECERTLADPLCILFTSGSTGLPKAVPVSHGAILRTVCNNNYTDLSCQSVISQIANISFDAALFELWGAWLHGGELTVVPREAALAPDTLRQYISARGISHMFLTTALFHELARQCPEVFEGLQTLLTGGQAGDLKLMHAVLDACHQPLQIVNGYGPTESTFYVSSYCPANHGDFTATRYHTAHAPLGKALNNTRLYVLDEQLQVVADGSWGQLYIAGMGLTSGYLDSAQLNAEKFTALTLPVVGTERLYASGDRVRYLPDGNLEFGGRLDNQLKIRGFRVEPAEVEACLRNCPNVANAAVRAFNDRQGELYLAAYLVAEPDTDINLSQVTAELAGELPAYAQPGVYECLSELPLTANGKLDYRALTEPQVKASDDSVLLDERPFDDWENIVVSHWQQLLGVPQADRNSDFFALGGQSILAMRLLHQINQALELSVPVATLFANPKLGDFLTAIASEATQQSNQALSVHFDSQDCYPLSYAQERLWVINQLQSQDPGYNIPFALEIHGSFDKTAFSAALSDLVVRHCSLRTVFKRLAGRPVQQVLSPFTVAIEEQDCRTHSDDELTLTLRHLARTPFDLSQLPLFRITLLNCAEERQILLFNFHHIIADGWSVRILQQELAELYESHCEATQTTLATLPLQVKDLAYWERHDSNQSAVNDAVSYWQTLIGSEPKHSVLPYDYEESGENRHQGEIFRLSLDSKLSEAIHTCCKQYSTTPYQFGLAAMALLLRRYNNSDKVIIGTPFANRQVPQSQSQIGFFVNMLPFVVDLDEADNTAQLLAQISQRFTSAIQYQHAPFDRIVDALGVERVEGETPLVRVVFDSQMHGIEANTEQQGSVFRALPLDMHSAKFDATFTLVEDEQGLGLAIEYNTQRFERDTIARFGANLQGVMTQLLEHSALAEVSVVAPQEQAQIARFSAAQTRYPVTDLATAFEQTAARFGDRIAVNYEGEALSYRELNLRAEQVSASLLALNISAGDFVAINVERSLDLIASIIAVLKLGAAYIPLDTHVPQDRIATILEDVSVAAFIVDQTPSEIVAASGAPWLALNELQKGEAADYDRAEILARRDSELPCYVIFTSGSTGRPKGVVVNHRNVVRLLKSNEQNYHFSEQDVFSLFHSYGFDVSVWEMWGALLYGGRIALVPQWVCRAPEQFDRFIHDQQVTILSQTPTAFLALMRAHLSHNQFRYDALRYVIFAGEKLDIMQLQPWFERYPERQHRLINMYGITETTVHNTYREITAADLTSGVGNVIGRQFDDLSIWVLNEQGEPQPLGVYGEMFVGGDGVTLGYLHRPELNAERFVTKQLDGREQRLYRSGDVAKWHPSGELVYRGRKDNQVKIRGFRIELGEIEAAFSALPQVEACEAMVWQRDEGDPCIVACLKMAATVDANIDEAAFKAKVQGRLPAYMIPAYLHAVNDFPLTSNGKADKKALLQQLQDKLARPAPNTMAVHHSKAVPDALSPLRTIWARVLKRNDFSDTDNFFTLGGDSISALEVVAAAAKQGIKLTAKQFMSNPTLAALAPLSDQLATAHNSVVQNYGQVPLTPIQQWFFAQQFTTPAGWDQSAIFALDLSIGQSELNAAVARLAEVYDLFHTRFSEQQGQQMQWLYDKQQNHAPLYQVIDAELHWQDEETRTQVLHEFANQVHQMVDPWQGCNLVFARICATHNEQPQQYLLVACHHLLIDGVSWRLLMKDLADALANPDTKLTAPQSGYRQWAEHLVEQAQKPEVVSEINTYWLSPKWQLSGVDEALQSDYEENLYGDATTVKHTLSSAATQALYKACQRMRCTLEEYLIARLYQSLTGLLDTDALVLDLESHGRHSYDDQLDVSATAGWFTSIYPVLLQGKAQQTDLVGCIKEQLRAVPEQGLSYNLARYLSFDSALREQLSALPKAWLSFNFLGDFSAEDTPDALLSAPLHHLPLGDNAAPENNRPYLLEVIFWLDQGQLHSRLIVNPDLLAGPLNSLANTLWQTLETLQSSDDTHLWPSDFSANRLNQEAMGELTQALTEQQLTLNNVDDVYPLTPVQQGIAFDTLADPGKGVYICQLYWTFTETLDEEAFVGAWQTLIDHNPILRTSFHFLSSGEHAQVVHTQMAPPLEHLDLTGSVQQAEQIDLALTNSRYQEFNLAQPGQFRLQLIRLSEQRTLFCWTYHHIILDGWSQANLLQQLSAALKPGTQMRSLTPYREYVDLVAGRDQQAQQQFWQTYLAALPEQRKLLLAPPTPDETQSFDMLSETLSDEQFTRLREHAEQQGTTLNNLVQAAWALTLSAVCHSNQVVFGITVSGRPTDMTGILDMTGLFINTLPMIVDCQPRQTGSELVQQISDCQSALMSWQFSSAQEIKKWAQIDAEDDLYESILVFENYPVDEDMMRGDGLAICDLHARENTAFGLTLSVCPGDTLSLNLGYKTARYNRAGIQTLLDSLCANLNRLTEDVHQPLQLSETALVCTAPMHAAQNTTLLDEFSQQVSLRAQATALTDGTQDVSFAELEANAKALAHGLIAQGCCPGDAVVLALPRSVDLIRALLAIWYAGGVYVPVDPGFPAERIEYIANKVKAKILICEESLLDSCQALTVPQCCIDTPQALASTIHPACELPGPSALAYVLFTSGSTGQPKGVEISHQALAEHIRWHVSEFDLQPQDSCLLITPVVFDASINALLPFMACGSSLYLAPADVHNEPDRLIALLRDNHISQLHLVPSMLDILLQQPEFATLDSLRYVKAGGEALKASTVTAFYQALPGSELINLYGPTECCVDSLFWRAPRTFGPEQAVKIGNPAGPIAAVVVDHNLNPVPDGVTGELLLSGLKLAQGYCNDSELTRRAFVTLNGQRYYRSGDLVWREQQGEYLYAGRRDHQVKLNGVRLEPEEIENQLATLAGVKELCVAVKPLATQNNKPVLVAYWVARKDTDDDLQSALRAHAEALLPQTHRPGVYQQLTALPRLPSLKVDRKKLPELNLIKTGQAQRVAPQSEAEHALVVALAELLSLETTQISLTDNYFSLGGDSLIAIQLGARLKRDGWRLQVKDLLAQQTLSQVAACCTALTGCEQAPVEARLSGPLVPIQARFFEQEFAEQHHWNQAFAFTLLQPQSPDFIAEVVTQLDKHHEIFRLRFDRQEGQWQQRIDQTSTGLVLEYHDLSQHNDNLMAEHLQLIAGDAQASLDLQLGPISKVLLFDCGQHRPQKLVFIMHHLAIDMMGWRAIFEDLYQLIESAEPQAETLLPTTLSYIEWGHHLAEHAGVYRDELNYWRSLPFDKVPALPQDFAVQDNTEACAEVVSVALDETRTDTLLRTIPQAFSTQINALLLTALHRVMAQWHGADHLAVSLEGHGRDELPGVDSVDISRTLGWFTKIYPVVLQLDQHADLVSSLQSIQSQLDAVPNKGMGYGVLKYASDQAEQLQHLPKPQIEFNYLGQFVSQGNASPKMVISDDAIGPLHSPKAHRSALLGIDCFVNQGQISFHWSFSHAIHRRETIEGLAHAYVKVLHELCQLAEAELT
ncbi:non-ribosomal peptide synthetase [Pseudoalteromonas sp. XMcav2-N-2]|uniref:non-ribosomal peptide synthetase n=1 Tax=unclassified Pseudoalteromonas TaxID=194690 RepID=UPI002097918D|nr:amino acid adenylation domain-containing protein [Pseudoalteromonas sp. XMcav2-N]